MRIMKMAEFSWLENCCHVKRGQVHFETYRKSEELLFNPSCVRLEKLCTTDVLEMAVLGANDGQETYSLTHLLTY